MAQWLSVSRTSKNTAVGVVIVAAALLINTFLPPGDTGGAGDVGGLDPCQDLPSEARDTISLVQEGGPYPYPDNDDARFGNYEGVLPDEELGYYREYTVDTPGVSHRGARRIVTGGEGEPEVWYYTDDHYESFCEVTDV